MLLIENLKDLIKEYEYEVQPLPSQIFSLKKIGTKIKIKEKFSEELFSTILSKLNCEFGTPVYVHPYYGFIWKNSDSYVAFDLVEEHYGYDSLNIFMFNKIPFGKKLKYDMYCSIDGAIWQVLLEHGFKNNSMNSYSSTGFAYFVSNEKMQVLLILKRKTLRCYFSKLTSVEHGLQKVTPHCGCKKTVNVSDTDKIKAAIEQCFAECNGKL